MDAFERKRLLTAYLQGVLPEEERRRLEAEYAADDELFEDLVELENDSIDTVARSATSGPERLRLVKGSALTDPQQQRLGFARALAELYRAPGREGEAAVTPATVAPSGSARRAGPSARTRLAVAATLVAVAAGFLGLFVVNGRLRRDVQALRDEQAGLRRSGQDVARQLERLGHEVRSQPPAGSGPVAGGGAGGGGDGGGLAGAPVRIASLRVAPGGGRGPGEAQVLRVEPGIAVVQLELDLERDEYPRYRAILQTPEGRPVWRQDPLESRRVAAGESRLLLRLSAGTLPTGDYVVRVDGVTASGLVEPVDAYSFTIVRDRAARK
jgi:hypothetical protein